MEDKRKSEAKKKDSKARCLVSRDFDTPDEVADALAFFYDYVMKRKRMPTGMFFIAKGKDKKGNVIPRIERLGEGKQ